MQTPPLQTPSSAKCPLTFSPPPIRLPASHFPFSNVRPSWRRTVASHFHVSSSLRQRARHFPGRNDRTPLQRPASSINEPVKAISNNRVYLCIHSDWTWSRGVISFTGELFKNIKAADTKKENPKQTTIDCPFSPHIETSRACEVVSESYWGDTALSIQYFVFVLLFGMNSHSLVRARA